MSRVGGQSIHLGAQERVHALRWSDDLGHDVRDAKHRSRIQHLVEKTSDKLALSLEVEYDGPVAHVRACSDRAKSQRLEALSRSDVVRRQPDGLTARVRSNFLSRHGVISLSGRTCC